MLNNIKIVVGGAVRRILVGYYRALGVRINGNVFISHGAYVDTTYRGSITIEEGSYITRGATLLAHDHSVYRRADRANDDGRGAIHLGPNSFIGMNAIVLRNVTIGENAVVGAGAVVTCDVPPNCIVAGNPARVIRTFKPRTPVA